MKVSSLVKMDAILEITHKTGLARRNGYKAFRCTVDASSLIYVLFNGLFADEGF